MKGSDNCLKIIYLLSSELILDLILLVKQDLLNVSLIFIFNDYCKSSLLDILSPTQLGMGHLK